MFSRLQNIFLLSKNSLPGNVVLCYFARRDLDVNRGRKTYVTVVIYVCPNLNCQKIPDSNIYGKFYAVPLGCRHLPYECLLKEIGKF